MSEVVEPHHRPLALPNQSVKSHAEARWIPRAAELAKDEGLWTCLLFQAWHFAHVASHGVSRARRERTEEAGRVPRFATLRRPLGPDHSWAYRNRPRGRARVAEASTRVPSSDPRIMPATHSRNGWTCRLRRVGTPENLCRTRAIRAGFIDAARVAGAGNVALMRRLGLRSAPWQDRWR
jgi:hypothetical protein